MLFSRADVANTIDLLFEPAWEMVRPVPLVTIDFGNGHKIQRTLNGNIATCVCDADAQVLDVLPGIYDPQTYLQQLNQCAYLAQYVAAVPPSKQAARLAAYHAAQRQALAKGKPALRLVNTAGITKSIIERPAKIILAQGTAASTNTARPMISIALPAATKSDIAEGKLLREDSRLNESKRRLLIHELLARQERVRPAEITRRVYRDVLHTDLDDPYLGLGKVLFAQYPFEDEGR